MKSRILIKNKGETRNYKTKKNELMSGKNKENCS